MSKFAFTASALALATAFTGVAQATPTGVYSGGGTAAEIIYRDIFNCYGATSGGDLGAVPGACSTPAVNTGAEVLYLGVGSGNGLTAFVDHDSSKFIAGARIPDKPPVADSTDLGVFYGTGVGAAWVPAAAGPFY